jgi:hypothetical protein
MFYADTPVAGRVAQICRHRFRQFRTTHGERDGCACLGKCACRLDTNTGRATCDDGILSGQVDAFDDIRSC